MNNDVTQPQSSHYVVVFTSQRTGDDAEAYNAMAAKMMALAAQQSGFLGVDSVTAADGRGITCSYWRTLGDIDAWKANAEHLMAQRRGQETWYANYQITVGKVERAYRFERDDR